MSSIKDSAEYATIYFVMIILCLLSMAAISAPVFLISWIAEQYGMWYSLLFIPYVWILIFILRLCFPSYDFALEQKTEVKE